MASPRSFGNFIGGLLRTNIAGGPLTRGSAVGNAEIQRQRGALYQTLKGRGAEGAALIRALEACGRDETKCTLSPELVAFFATLPAPPTYAYSAAQQRARSQAAAAKEDRYGPGFAGVSQEQCGPRGGVPVRRADGTFLCRRRSSSSGPGARSQVARDFRREVDYGLRPNTWDSCRQLGGTPVVPAGWTAGPDRSNEITACRSPTNRARGASFGGGAADARVAQAIAAARGGAAAGAGNAYDDQDYGFDGEDYGYDDQFDGEDEDYGYATQQYGSPRHGRAYL